MAAFLAEEGGRELICSGDSTMRQIFAAFACMIPRALVESYEPVWGRKGPRVQLQPQSAVALTCGGRLRWEDGRVQGGKRVMFSHLSRGS